MTKKELLNILENTTLGIDPDPERKAIYDKYCRSIMAILKVLPDNAELDGIAALKEKKYSSMTSFEIFIRESTNDVEYALRSLAERLGEWTENYIKIHTAETTVLNNKSRKKHIGVIIFLVFIVVAVILAVIFSVLDIAGKITYGNEVSTVIGCCDFFCGVAFFIYELITDKGKETAHDEAQKAAKNGDYPGFYSKYEKDINANIGCCNTIKSDTYYIDSKLNDNED